MQFSMQNDLITAELQHIAPTEYLGSEISYM